MPALLTLVRRAAGASVAALLAVALLGARPPAAAQDAAEPGAAEPGDAERGEALYLAGCQSCHGADGAGVGPWPAIIGAGAAAADYQLRTGRMPFAQATGQQALRKPPAYGEQEIRDLVAHVATLGEGPEIPTYELDDDLLQRGQRLYVENCAPCHGATGNGGATGGGWFAPPLRPVEPQQVAEAILIGPGQMPAFGFSDDDLSAVVTYVNYLRTAEHPGGFEIGGIGPVPEGLVGWAVGMGALTAIAVLVGREWSHRRAEPRGFEDGS